MTDNWETMQISITNKKLIEELRTRGVKNIDRVLNEFLTEILTEMESLTNETAASVQNETVSSGGDVLRRSPAWPDSPDIRKVN